MTSGTTSSCSNVGAHAPADRACRHEAVTAELNASWLSPTPQRSQRSPYRCDRPAPRARFEWPARHPSLRPDAWRAQAAAPDRSSRTASGARVRPRDARPDNDRWRVHQWRAARPQPSCSYSRPAKPGHQPAGPRGGDFRSIGITRHASSGANPVLCVPAIKPVTDRGSRSCVADSHFAHSQQFHTGFNRHHPVGDSLGAVIFAERRALGKIGCRRFQRHFVDAQIGIGQFGELVHSRPTGHKVLHHLRSNLGRKGRDATRGDAVITRKHRDTCMGHVGRMTFLPHGNPFGDFLQTAQ